MPEQIPDKQISEFEKLLNAISNENDKALTASNEILKRVCDIKNCREPEEELKKSELQTGVLGRLYEELSRMRSVNNTLRIANNGLKDIVG